MIIRRAIALHSWSGSHPNLSNMFDMLLPCLWSFMVNRAALRWMDYSLVMSLARYGSHAMFEYYSRDRTKRKYASRRSCWGHVLRLWRRNHSVLFAFAVGPVMWFSQQRLQAMVMPRYWMLSTLDRTWPSIEYKWSDVTLLLVIDIMWHFEVLKLIPQVLAQSQRLLRSVWRS